MSTNESWVTDACTLPTVERPLREAEFDEVFASAVRRVERPSPVMLRLTLEHDAEVAARVADLAVRETACCAFFTFGLTAAAGSLQLDVTVEPGQVPVLDALTARAGAVVGS
jgi:hypothetical protein